MISEAKKTKKFLDTLRLVYPGSYVLKLNLPTHAGVPDALVLYEGRVCFIEFKQGGYQMTELQRLTAKQIANAGVRTWLVYFGEGMLSVAPYDTPSATFYSSAMLAIAQHIMEAS